MLKTARSKYTIDKKYVVLKFIDIKKAILIKKSYFCYSDKLIKNNTIWHLILI